ncbi:MAG TPA: peptide deformylase [Burkholderiaceae bacterium]|nr:peptide deformylase [Burkholderiaceae bacterium]
MIREILRMGDARLLRVAEPVRDFGTAELRTLVADMFDTMHAASGAGLAAPQIGVPLRVVIFGYADPEMRNPRYPDADPVPQTILVNPELEPLPGALEEGWEGCLSVPGLRGVVERHANLRYRGFDLDGRPIERVATGFHARVVQHECDHLDGILYPMRVRDFSRFGYTDVLFPELVAQTDD